MTQTPVAGYDAKKSISPNFPISLDKFLLEYAVILAIMGNEKGVKISCNDDFPGL